MATDMTAFDAMLKEHLAEKHQEMAFLKETPAYGLIKKNNKKYTDVGGLYWREPIHYAFGGGGSSNFAKANANSTTEDSYEDWKVTRRKHYRVPKIDNEVIWSSMNNSDAFDRALVNIDNHLKAEAHYLNFRFYRGSGGAVGQMANATVATSIITFADAASVWGITKGDKVELSATDGTSGSVRAGVATIASVQRTAGTVTVAGGNITVSIAAAAITDYVFLEGDHGTSYSLSASGLADWVPDAAPSATSFFGVDRTLDTDRLGGMRITHTAGTPVSTMLIDQAQVLDNLGRTATHAFLHTSHRANLTKEAEGKWVVDKGMGYGGRELSIGFKGFQVNLGGQDITLVFDPMCPTKRIYMGCMDTVRMISAGPAPMFLLEKQTGKVLKPSESGDSWECRLGEYYNFAVGAPGDWCVGIVS